MSENESQYKIVITCLEKADTYEDALRKALTSIKAGYISHLEIESL
jgi:hypothetical protein